MCFVAESNLSQVINALGGVLFHWDFNGIDCQFHRYYGVLHDRIEIQSHSW